MAERLTIAKVNTDLQTHKQTCEQVILPELEKQRNVLFGPDGDNGMVYEVKAMKASFDKMTRLGYAVIVAIVVELAVRLLNIGV